MINDHRGIAALEFVLIAPVILFAFAGMIDIQRMMFNQNILAQTVTLAAIGAAVTGPTAPVSFDQNGVTINEVPDGSTVTVTGSTLYQWFALPFAAKAMSMTVTVTIIPKSTGNDGGTGAGHG